MENEKSKLIKIAEPQYGYALDFDTPRIKASPFIKWAGGKRNLIPTIKEYMPPREKINKYFEPFLGGGALFFHLQRQDSILSDANQELIELYTIVRDKVEELIETLKIHKNDEDYYYEVRAQKKEDLTPVQRAARFIFLNKTCFNGLYRVNSKGLFNVPFGRYKNPKICDEEGLRSASLVLKNSVLIDKDFAEVVKQAHITDFIYFDPPYQPISKTSSFTSYTIKKFDETEQRRLARIYTELAEKGCFVMLSNSNAPLIRELYNGFQIHEVQANRAISSKADGRGKIKELLIVNYCWEKN